MANRKRFAGASGLASFASRLALIGLLAIALQLQSPRVSGTGDPQITQPVLAVIHGCPALGQPVSEPLVIPGSNFGSGGALEFVYGNPTKTVSVDSTTTNGAIKAWGDREIKVQVPDEVGTGTLTVIAGGQRSDPVDLLVYEHDSFDIPRPEPGNDPLGLALAVAPDGKTWMNREGHLYLQGFDPQSRSFTNLLIPQAAGEGIFARMVSDDRQTRTSQLGEDVEVDSQGNVWFSEGGAVYYPGKGNDYTVACTIDPVIDPDCHYCKPGDSASGTCKTAEWYNTSRVVKYDPTNATNPFSCFNSPMDNAEIQGLLVDEGRKIVWYAEGSVASVAKDPNGTRSGNAITGITMSSTLSNCNFDPYDSSQRRDQICANDDLPGTCHWRFPLPVENAARSPAHLALDGNGNIWFTEYWGNRIGRLNPHTGEIIELPLPPSINTDPSSPAVWFGSGPWELHFDGIGKLWVTEYFDATIVKIDPSLMDTNDCLNLTNGQNPSITEVYQEGGNPPAHGASIHTLDIAPDGTDGTHGKIWFVLTHEDGQTIGQVGFIDPDNSAAVLLPILKTQYGTNVFLDGIGDAAGVAVDPQSGDIYFMEYSERQLGRLRLALCPRTCHQIGNGVGIPGEDATVPSGPGDACDDMDNDGVPNASDPDPAPGQPVDITYDDNNNGVMCPADTADDGPSWDWDCDGKRDGWVGACGSTSADADTDGLMDAWENCKWGTNPAVIDSDGDTLGDCRETADVDGNGVVNFPGDVIYYSKAIQLPPAAFGRDGDFDIDGNNVLNYTGDVVQEAKFALISGLCK